MTGSVEPAFAEVQVHAAFAHVDVGVAVLDHSGTVVDANQALLTLLGSSPAQLGHVDLADRLDAADRAELRDAQAQVLTGQRPRVRFSARLTGGETLRWLQVTVAVIDDQPRRVLVLLDDVTDRHELERTLRHQATHDPLTGLPNRALFLERLGAAFEPTSGAESAGGGESAELGLCYLDLDGFKAINDSLGHHVGDQLLIAVARRLDRCLADARGFAARIGGDEFAILLRDCPDERPVIAVAERVLAALRVPVRVQRHELTVTASIGVVAQAADATTPTELMRSADITLYWAKSDGKAGWARYDEDRNAREITRFTLSATMPAALERGEFFLEYQPIVRLPSTAAAPGFGSAVPDGAVPDGDATVGAEALVRWQHPELGRLGPDQFIALAEETGLIAQLGGWVLRQACWQATEWHGEDAPFVSVNLAGRQARDLSLVSEVASILAESGLPAHRLQLEFTENTVMGVRDDADAVLGTLHGLADLGVRIAIDNFGTGYSNLAYLRRLPVHALKIAGPLVDSLRGPTADPVDLRLAETLVSMAHTLGLTVTVAGVETPAQAWRLQAIGSDAAQGWLYAKAGPAQDIAAARSAELPSG